MGGFGGLSLFWRATSFSLKIDLVWNWSNPRN